MFPSGLPIRFFLIYPVFFARFIRSLAAEVYLGLQAYGGSGKALGVGLAPFASPASDSLSASLASSMRSVMREDILFSRLFTVAEGGPEVTDKLDSVTWGGLGAQVVVTANVKADGPDALMECRIYDVTSGKILWGKEGKGSKLNFRRLAHLMADLVTYQLSGQPGVAHTRIAFVNNHTGNKEIYVMDYDGADVRQLTHFHSITLGPKWSPDGKSIAFVSYKAGNPDAYLMDANGGNVQDLSNRQGLNSAPNWAPDGNTLALTLSRGGDPELYLLERSGRIVRRLTYSPGVDTSPTFFAEWPADRFCFRPHGQSRAVRHGRDGRRRSAADVRTMDRCAGLVSAGGRDRLRAPAQPGALRYLCSRPFRSQQSRGVRSRRAQ